MASRCQQLTMTGNNTRVDPNLSMTATTLGKQASPDLAMLANLLVDSCADLVQAPTSPTLLPGLLVCPSFPDPAGVCAVVDSTLVSLTHSVLATPSTLTWASLVYMIADPLGFPSLSPFPLQPTLIDARRHPLSHLPWRRSTSSVIRPLTVGPTSPRSSRGRTTCSYKPSWREPVTSSGSKTQAGHILQKQSLVSQQYKN